MIRDERQPAKPAGPILLNLANVKPEPVRWLWPGRIPLGKLTLLVGDPGLGKSFVTLDIAARVTRGAAWPDDSSALAPAGGVVLLSAEDDPADTIRPRLDAAGADVRRVNILTGIGGEDRAGTYERAVDLGRDVSYLEGAIKETPDCRLVVIDPISAYLGKTDSHKNAEVRGLLTPLAKLAGRHRVAVLAVTHLRKAEGAAIYRSMGSLAFAAAARAAWVVAKDRKNPTRRLMLPVKNNLACDVKGLAYTIGPYGANEAAAVAWEAEPVEVSADDALAVRCTRGVSDEVVDWLREVLADGKMRAGDVLQQGRQNGYSDKAIRKAFEAIGGKRHREGFGPGGKLIWCLPTIDSQAGPIDAIDSRTGNNGNNGQQWAAINAELASSVAAEDENDWGDV